MTRFSASAASLVVVWSLSMSFFALSAFEDDWVWGLVGGIVLVVFGAAAGRMIPRSRKRVPPAHEKTANWLLQLVGALITTELLTAALIAWAMGNRTQSASNGYQVLGLLILLALLAVGPGVIVTSVIALSSRRPAVRKGGHGDPHGASARSHS